MEFPSLRVARNKCCLKAFNCKPRYTAECFTWLQPALRKLHCSKPLGKSMRDTASITGFRNGWWCSTYVTTIVYGPINNVTDCKTNYGLNLGICAGRVKPSLHTPGRRVKSSLNFIGPVTKRSTPSNPAFSTISKHTFAFNQPSFTKPFCKAGAWRSQGLSLDSNPVSFDKLV